MADTAVDTAVSLADAAAAADDAAGAEAAAEVAAEAWALAELLAARGVDHVTYKAWLRVSAAEEELARSLGRGDRVKLPHRTRSGPPPAASLFRGRSLTPLRSGYLSGILDDQRA